ncbi:MAG: YbcC family protein [Oligoflexus sp.]
MSFKAKAGTQHKADSVEDMIDQMLRRIAHWLPAQGPLKDFIHHNTLHALQDRPFHEALCVAEELYGANSYLCIEEYQNLYRAGAISERGLLRAIKDHPGTLDEKALIRTLLFQSKSSSSAISKKGLAGGGLRNRWMTRRQIDLNRKVHPFLFRFLSNFLDQGVSIWSMPYAHGNFWNAVRRLAADSYVPLPALTHSYCETLLNGTPEQAIIFCLEKLVGMESHYEAYLLAMLLAHPGWSGMVSMIERQPSSLINSRDITLKEMVAFELVLEFGAIATTLGDTFEPIVSEEEAPPVLPFDRPATSSEEQILKKIWQEAYEWSLYEDVLGSIYLNSRKPGVPPPPANAQAFFCIDDRECSLRRHIEEVDASVVTWSVAGFFGIDFFYQGASDFRPSKLCPAPLIPKYLVTESKDAPADKKQRNLIRLLHLAPSNTLFRGWLVTQTLGLWHSIRLASLVFKPSLTRPTDQSLSHIEAKGTLHLLRQDNSSSEDGLLKGYSIEEMAERVCGVLKSTGCTGPFSKLMVIVAHGSSSVNNPYFAAYDCGACSGRPGAPNARAFAWMANNQDVRTKLIELGLFIPEDCLFLGAAHDTARDDIVYFGAEDLPASHQEIFEKFRRTVIEALKRNAKERCRRFELARPGLTASEALAHVRQRASSIFEPRPELNHASNAICIVGRRDLTRGLFLDRRAFLNSYNPNHDPEGKILAGILAAAIPVCSGINLEYYFSRVDSEIYGAGTKLPHNIVGLVSVSNGVEGDLLTGLPTQMTEAHDPLRLLVVVEHEPDIVHRVIEQNPSLSKLVFHEWVRCACFSPTERQMYFFLGGEFIMVPLDHLGSLPSKASSMEVIAKQNKNIGVHSIERS